MPQIAVKKSFKRGSLAPGDNTKPNTTLDTYLTKSFEHIIGEQTAVSNPKTSNAGNSHPQGNKRILAMLTNNKQLEVHKFGKKNSDTGILNSLEVSDAYSYGSHAKKNSIKLRTQESVEEQFDSIHSESISGDKAANDKMSAETYYTQMKEFHKQIKSFTKNTNSDVKGDKIIESDRRVTEHDSTFDKDFQSPADYKAVSPSPNLNTSAMSKEIGLDDRSSIMKEEKDNIFGEEIVSFPLSAAKTIIHFGKYLSEYEESEILNYMVIYYINKNSKSDESPERVTKSTKKSKKSKNDWREIKVAAGEQLWYRYEIIESLGKGAFGEVLKWYDHKEKELLAIKILKNSADNFEQGMNEVNILRYLKESDQDDVRNIIKLKESFVFRNQICIGFELMDMNLYDVIKGRNFRGMKVKYIRRIALHILVGLCYLSRQQVIHWDLKPENILLKK